MGKYLPGQEVRRGRFEAERNRICKGQEVGQNTLFVFTITFGARSQMQFVFLKNLFIYLFIYGCVGSSLLHTGSLQLQQAGDTLCCSAWASHRGGFSCCGAQALGVRASVVVARRLSSCGSQAQ